MPVSSMVPRINSKCNHLDKKSLKKHKLCLSLFFVVALLTWVSYRRHTNSQANEVWGCDYGVDVKRDVGVRSKVVHACLRVCLLACVLSCVRASACICASTFRLFDMTSCSVSDNGCKQI